MQKQSETWRGRAKKNEREDITRKTDGFNLRPAAKALEAKLPNNFPSILKTVPKC